MMRNKVKYGTSTFSREFKLEAVKLVTERGMTASQAASDLGIAAHPVVAEGLTAHERNKE